MTTQAYLEHVAIRVRDLAWHVRFFEAIFGWTVRQVDGDSAEPKQVWIGGMQLIAASDFDGARGHADHVGIRCRDVEAAIAAAHAFAGVTTDPRGSHWLKLPDGFVVELLPAGPEAPAVYSTL
ncbi:MAG: VOC family protein [Bosea sp.]|uniref:VOC family protein n=1 Tax=Bosea sp. (in: a-proteobacteria) TaxID=1871050 RepID=UPI0023939CCF|nr:VOC family protein [Bosea sp. (in: a-proteobacteria)]MCP4737298.1 VOC family protein [Bosea sp. (in: a-proteobacteria)]